MNEPVHCGSNSILKCVVWDTLKIKMGSRKSKLLLETDLIHPFGFDEWLIFQNFLIEETMITTMIFVQN